MLSIKYHNFFLFFQYVRRISNLKNVRITIQIRGNQIHGID